MTRTGKVLIALVLLGFGTVAAIATNDTIGVTAGSGKLANLIKFASTNVMSEVGICDATTENTCAAVAAGALSVNAGILQGGNTAVVKAASTAAAATDPALVVTISPNGVNANGRATSANSAPVVPSAAPTTWHLIAANSTNATSVKGSATTLLSCQLGNNSTTIGYLKIYNKATSPTVGSDTPVKTLLIPGPAAGGSVSNIEFGNGGLALGVGFAAAVTTGIADSDTGAVAATAIAINCDYE